MAAWVLLGYGLFLTSPDPQGVDDLEGGGRFAAWFGFYVPFIWLSTFVLMLGGVGLFRSSAGIGAPATLAGLDLGFAGWVLANRWLDEALPDLERMATATLAVAVVVLTVLFTVRALQRRREHAGAAQAPHRDPTASPPMLEQ